MEIFLTSIDGQKVFLRCFGNGKKAIVLVHGLAEHSGRYDFFAKKLAKAGFSVFAMDFRGHGKSGNKRGDIKSLTLLLSDLEVVFNFVRSKGFEKIGLFGHSAGGGICALFASQNKVDFLVLTSPVVYEPKKLKIIRAFPYEIMPFLKIKKRIGSSPEMLEKSYADPLSTNKISFRTIGVLLDKIPRKLKKQSKNITCPIFLGFGKSDTLLTESEKFFKFLGSTSSKNKKIVGFEANHRIVNNEGAEQRIDVILEWLKTI